MSTGTAVALAPTPAFADPEVARLLRITFCVHQTPEPQKPRRYEWTRADIAPNVDPRCWQCSGRGWSLREYPCKCVTRAIFRRCMVEWIRNRDFAQINQMRPEQLAQRGGRTIRKGGWSLLRQEFVADFELLAKRTLDPLHYRVWRAYHCNGLHWRVAAPNLRLDKGRFYHAVYRVEDQLGRAARETQPYALFPIDEYYYR